MRAGQAGYHRTARRRAPALTLLVALVALSAVVSGVAAQPASAVNSGAIRTLGSPDVCKNTQLALGDDNSSAAVALPFTINFFGRTFSQLYVNNNGNVTFDGSMYDYTPFSLVSTTRQIIAPFFGDVDTRGSNDPTVAVTYSYGFSSAIDIYGDGVARKVFCVDWMNVGYYSQHFDKRNSFQLLLIDRSDVGAGNFDIEFNYDKINWETGDASGGVGGLGGFSARAGYSNGGTAALEISGSAVNGAFLDSNATTGLVHRSYNSTQLGRFSFPVRNTTTATPADASAVYGQPNVALTTTARDPSGAGLNEGTVTFTVKRPDGSVVGTATSGTVSGGTASASFALAGVAAGTYAVTAHYNGSNNFNPSDSPGAGTLAIAVAGTTTTPDAKTIAYGQPISLSAHVAGTGASTAPVNEGTVQFTVKNGTTVLGTATSATVSGGVGTAAFSALAPGSYAVDASYSGTSNYSGSVGAASGTLTVNKAATTTVVSPQSNTVTFGTASVDVTVAVTSPTGGTPTGNVTIGITGGAVSSIIALDATGHAATSIDLRGFDMGSYTIAADYGGGTNFNTSTGTATLTIQAAATTTTAAPPIITATFGAASVGLSGTVSSLAGTPTGSVRFGIRGVPTTYVVDLDATGKAATQITLAGVNAGSYTIDVAFLGSLNFAPSAATVAFTLDSLQTSTTVSDVTALLDGSSVTLTATVTNTVVVNGGAVTFTVANAAGAVIGAATDAPVVAGHATAQYAIPTGTAGGSYKIAAHYGNSPNFRSSDATPATLTLTKGVSGIAKCGNTVVPLAKVELLSGDTVVATVDQAGADGSYVFLGVKPGDYTIRISKDQVVCGTGVSVSATGAVVVVSPSQPIDLLNHFWQNACDLTPGATTNACPPPPTPTMTTASTTSTVAVSATAEHLFKKHQSAFFKIRVHPGDRVKVRLTNLSFNADLTMYRNPALAFGGTGTTARLARLGAEFADTDFGDTDFGDTDFGDTDFGDTDFGDTDFGDTDFGDTDFGDTDFGDTDFGDTDFGDTDFGDTDFGDTDFGSVGEAIPADRHSSALRRSRIRISAHNGTADERLVGTVWGDIGWIYLKVHGRHGAFSLAQPFRLEVRLIPGSCTNVAPISVTAGALGQPGGASVIARSSAPIKTVLVTDFALIAGTDAEKAALRTAIASFVARPEVVGIALDVGTDARVIAARAQAAANVLCPSAVNLVADEIKRNIDAFRPDAQFGVFAGGDLAIPFYREPDRASLASEANWGGPPVVGDTTSQAAIRRGYVWSQVRYGSGTEFARKDRNIPVADLAVGRAVETAAEITNLLNAYMQLPGGVLTVSAAPVVTGYGGMADGAHGVSSELSTGTGFTSRELIHDGGPNDLGAWSADQLRTTLLGCATGVCTQAESSAARADVSFVAMHGNPGSGLAADYKSRLLASEIASSTVDMTNSLTIALSCHYSYNTVDGHALMTAATPDFAQAYARKGAAVIGGVGYQYFETQTIDFAEREYVELARQLRTGTQPIGKALATALRRYLAYSPADGTHEKQYLETALFGIPHLTLRMNGTLLSGDDTSAITATTPVSPSLSYADLASSFSLTPHHVTLRDATTGTALTPDATYLSGSNGTFAYPTQQLLPLEVRNVTRSGNALAGVGIRSGTFTDVQGVRPLTSAPATETASVHATYYSNVFQPVQPWRESFIEAMVDGATRVAITPAMYRSASSGSPTGTRREFSAMTLRLFYTNDLSAAALAAAPGISDISALQNADGSITFRVKVLSGSPVVQTWITYFVDGQTTLTSIDLDRDATDQTLWTKPVTFTVPVGNVHYLVQSANSAGLVARDTNGGAYYTLGVTGPTLDAPRQTTELALGLSATGGAYGSTVTLSAKLTSGGVGLDGQKVLFNVGPRTVGATTQNGGAAIVQLRLFMTPGNYKLTTSFEQTTAYLASSTPATDFNVTKVATTLTLSSASTGPVQYGDPSGVQATLKDASGRGVGQHTMFFILRSTDPALPAYASAELTDQNGVARLFTVPVPAGTYTLSAYFSGDVPLPGVTLHLSDPLYLAGSASGTLTVTAEGATPTYNGDRIIAAGATLRLAAAVTQDADGSLGDLSLARVRYLLTDESGAPVAGASLATGPGADGTFAGAFPNLAAGLYHLVITVEGGSFASATPPLTDLVVVYDPSMFVTGGGWVRATPTSTAVGAPKLGFNLKYRDGTTTPTGSFELQLKGPDWNVKATSYAWLVITHDATNASIGRAEFLGVATINGAGSSCIRVVVTDAPTGDTFAADIWQGTSCGADVPATAPTRSVSGPLGGGNITVH